MNNEITYQIIVHVNVNGLERMHKLVPITSTLEDYLEKLDYYQTYGVWEYYEATCLNEYNEQYNIILSDSLLRSTYFIFKRIEDEGYFS